MLMASKGESRSVNDSATHHFIHNGRRISTANAVKRHHPHIPPPVHRHLFPLYHPHSLDIVVFWEIPSQGRSGHILLPGLSLGAGHAHLTEVTAEAENMKLKRSMYAETARERLEILKAARNGEWNTEMNPVDVAGEAGSLVQHDFTKGYATQTPSASSHHIDSSTSCCSRPCRVPVTFTLRNHSLTNPVRFRLKLTSSALDHPPPV